MTDIKKTRDYSLFKYVDGNRDIRKPNLKKLVESIQKDNQLCLHPIIVNEHLQIIDGQHRLEAAKALNVDIYYLQSSTVTHQHIIDANVNQKSFETGDYIKFFCVRGNPVYLQLHDMLTQTGLKPKALLTLVLGAVSTNILMFLKTGKFKFPEKENPAHILRFYAEFMHYVKDKRIKPLSIFTNHNFTRALRWLFNTAGFNQIVFFKKLDLRWFDLKPQRTAQDWYQLLLNIYNFKNQNRIEDERTNEA